MIEPFEPYKPERVDTLPKNIEDYIYQLKVDGGNSFVDVELPISKVYHIRKTNQGLVWTQRTYRYPDLVADIKNGSLRNHASYVGELTVHDEQGIGRQKLFMHRQTENPFDAGRIAELYPIHFYAHHVIRDGNDELWNVPYSKQLELLPVFVKQTANTHIVPTSKTPNIFLEQKGKIEGIVAKKLDGTYHRGKEGCGWVKQKFLKEETVKFITYEERDVGINLFTDKDRPVHLAGDRVTFAIQSIEDEGCVMSEIEFLEKNFKGYRDCSIKRLWRPSEQKIPQEI